MGTAGCVCGVRRHLPDDAPCAVRRAKFLVLAASPLLSAPRPLRSHHSMFSQFLSYSQTLLDITALSLVGESAVSLPSESMPNSLEYNAPPNSLDLDGDDASQPPPTPIAHHTRSHIICKNPWSMLETALMLFQLEMFAHASKHPFSEIAKAHPTGREYTEREMDAMRLGISEDELVAARSACPQAANDTLSQAAIFACEAVKDAILRKDVMLVMKQL